MPHPVPPLYVVTEHTVEFPVLYGNFQLAVYFTYGDVLIYVSMLLSQFVPPSPSPAVSTNPFSMSTYLFSSVQSLSCVWLFATSWTAARQASLSITNSNSCPWSQWCHPTISSSVVPFFSRLQSFPASRTFQMSRFFESGGQSIGVSASASVLPMNIQDWFPLRWISLKFKGLSGVFSNTTVQKHQFFGAQLCL